MPRLSDVIANEESLEKAAQAFADLCIHDSDLKDDMNNGIKTSEDLVHIIQERSEHLNLDYNTFCRIGALEE